MFQCNTLPPSYGKQSADYFMLYVASFFLGAFFRIEGADIYLRNVRLSSKYTAIQT
jgi:hypothetical protein